MCECDVHVNWTQVFSSDYILMFSMRQTNYHLSIWPYSAYQNHMIAYALYDKSFCAWIAFMIIYCSRNEQRSIYSNTIAFNTQNDNSVKHCYASKNKMTIVYTCPASDYPHTTSPIALVLFMGRREFIVWQRSGHGPNWLFVIILLCPFFCALALSP